MIDIDLELKLCVSRFMKMKIDDDVTLMLVHVICFKGNQTKAN